MNDTNKLNQTTENINTTESMENKINFSKQEIENILEISYNCFFYDWLLFEATSSCCPLEWNVYKNWKAIWVFHSRSSDSCCVWNQTIYDTRELLLGLDIENVIKDLLERLKSDETQKEEREKIKSLLSYYDKKRYEKQIKSPILFESFQFLNNCEEWLSYLQEMAKLINWYIWKIWENNIWTTRNSEDLLEENIVKKIEEMLIKNKKRNNNDR